MVNLWFFFVASTPTIILMAVKSKPTWDDICEQVKLETGGECYLTKQNRKIILRKHGSTVGVRLDSEAAFDPIWLNDILNNWQEWPE